MICPNSSKNKECMYYFKDGKKEYCAKYKAELWQFTNKCDY